MKKIYLIYLLLICCFIYFLTNHYIPKDVIGDNYRFYAYHMYFIKLVNILNSTEAGFWEKIRTAFYALRTSLVPGTILASFFGWWIGTSRIIFIQMVSYIYVLPTIILTFWFYKKTLGKDLVLSNWIEFLFIIIISCNPIYWLPTVNTMPDTAALIPFILLFYISTKYDYTKINIKNILITGILLFLTFFFRRHFSTAIFVLLMTITIINIFKIIKENFVFNNIQIKKTLIILLKFAFNMLAASFIFLILFKIFDPRLFNYFINGSMLEECNFYNSDKNIFEKLKDFTNYFPLMYIAICILPLFMIRKIKANLYFLSIFYLYPLLYFLLFLLIQDFVFENLLSCAFILNILFLHSVFLISNYVKEKKSKIFIIISIAIFSIINLFTVLNAYLPNNNENYRVFLKIYEFISKETLQDKGKTFTSITEERLFDSETYMYYALLINDTDFYNRIENIPAPKQHGLNFKAYNSDYISTMDFYGEFDKEKTGWLPIYLPYRDFQNNTGIAKYYKKIYEIKTEREPVYNLYIYKKIKDIPIEEMERLANNFIESDSNYESLIKEQLETYKKHIKSGELCVKH